MKLYTYFRSSAAYRVRIALNLKGLDYESIPVNLLKHEHLEEPFRSINAQSLLPLLTLDDGTSISQSMAIIQYLEWNYPDVPLLPDSDELKIKVLELQNIIACDIHPLNNLRVLRYLQNQLGISQSDRSYWYSDWIIEGFETIEEKIDGKGFTIGSRPTAADCFLIPQVYNAIKSDVSMQSFPKINAVYERCNELEAFVKAAPENQPDFPDQQ